MGGGRTDPSASLRMTPLFEGYNLIHRASAVPLPQRGRYWRAIRESSPTECGWRDVEGAVPYKGNGVWQHRPLRILRREEAVHQLGGDDGIRAGHNKGVAPTVLQLLLGNDSAVYGQNNVCVI